MMQTIPRIAVNDGTNLRFLKAADILYCLADGSYTAVYLVNKDRIVLSKNIKTIGSNLPEDDFVRVHQSCIVNLAHVQHYTNGRSNIVRMSNGEEIPVSRNRKAQFLSQFRKL